MNNCFKRTVTTAAVIGGVVGSAWVGTKLLSETKVREIKPYFKKRAPYVFAHRGGLGIAPEHTMAAFKKANEFEVDGFEVDIRMTKDEKIVVMHDQFIDRTSNGTGRVSNYTLKELENFDFGYHFKDAEGNFPYRGHEDAKIVTLEALLNKFPDKLVNIDIKDAPESYEGSLMPSLLYRLITELDVKDRVLVTSFHDEQINRFRLYDDEVAVGAGPDQIRNAVLYYNSGFGHLYTPDADTFQIPTQYNGFPLNTSNFIHFLQDLNIAVGYWTINDMDEMDDLIQKGAHTIVTDYPDMSHHVLKTRY